MKLLTIILMSSAALIAQVPSATITGTVHDPTGAVVPKAKVIAKSTDTLLEMSRESAADGTFRLAGLAPGNYTVRVVFPAFVPPEYSLRLEVRQVVDLDVQLKLPGTHVEMFAHAV